jgi:uncharacterized membrane protein
MAGANPDDARILPDSNLARCRNRVEPDAALPAVMSGRVLDSRQSDCWRGFSPGPAAQRTHSGRVPQVDGSTRSGWNGVMNSNVTSGPLYNWTQAIYALHAFSLLTGILGAATIVGAFLTGWPSLIAVILNYVKRGDVRGTWLESHFQWQIRTFWYGLLWIGLCILFVVLTFGIGILIAWLPAAIVGLWFVYRIIRGWLALREGRPMYV